MDEKQVIYWLGVTIAETRSQLSEARSQLAQLGRAAKAQQEKIEELERNAKSKARPVRKAVKKRS